MLALFLAIPLTLELPKAQAVLEAAEQRDLDNLLGDYILSREVNDTKLLPLYEPARVFEIPKVHQFRQ